MAGDCSKARRPARAGVSCRIFNVRGWFSNQTLRIGGNTRSYRVTKINTVFSGIRVRLVEAAKRPLVGYGHCVKGFGHGRRYAARQLFVPFSFAVDYKSLVQVTYTK